MPSILEGLPQGTRTGLISGGILLVWAFGEGSWLLGLIAVAVLALTGRNYYARHVKKPEPWPWPPYLRDQAEALARPIDPTPKRILPADEKTALVAKVATTKDDLARLVADKPPAWPWALFASVLVQRRNAVGARLRDVASGYQPRSGMAPLSGPAYSQTAQQAMSTIVDICAQLEQFMLSPAFKGAFGQAGSNSDTDADADAVTGVANRLMDYHQSLLVQAETCLQTPVDGDEIVFVQDVGALTLQPLIGYDIFIYTMCARIGEAQDLLPYGKGVIELDEVALAIDMPDGLSERIHAHLTRLNS